MIIVPSVGPLYDVVYMFSGRGRVADQLLPFST
jgi:hypothetical protein